MNISYVFDDKFSDKFIVSAYSAAKNTRASVAIYIVDCGISEKNKKKIIYLREKCENILSIKFGVPKRVEVLEKFPIADHFSSAVFYRLAIPKVFPKLRRVIYVDCDTIVDGDITTFWGENLDGRPFGAVEAEGNFFDGKMRFSTRQRLGITDERRYYSSGALLIDCAKFKESGIFQRVIDQIKSTESFLRCPEQDAINMCLENSEHMPLSPVYNFSPFAPLARKCFKQNPNIVVIHYSMCKPWLTSKKLLKALHSIGLFRYSAAVVLKFWKYADEIGFSEVNRRSVSYTLNFLYKRTFQPLERFVSGKIRNKILNLMKNFRNMAACRKSCDKK
ncbi:MAG: glycosyltransferase family 8 protein [Puniceicoccales bacterium]|nr:glycosyltransferase family 8 protein [Puniceicoccales bacterium]